MKAARVHELGTIPHIEECARPTPQAAEVVMRVRAASLKNLDKVRVSGTHYTASASLPLVPGVDGMVEDERANRWYVMCEGGMFAEWASIDPRRCVAIPESVSDAVAAALPNAVLGSASALRCRTQFAKDSVVLVHGATGVTGKVAVQVAQLYGASRVIATGRNPKQLDRLHELGALHTVSLMQSDEHIVEQIVALHRERPIDIVLDYTWGHPLELILTALQQGAVDTSRPVRVITIGQMAGATASLSSSSFRSTAIEMLGSGIGSLSTAQIHASFNSLLPEIFNAVADGRIVVDTQSEALSSIADFWNEKIEGGTRLVFDCQR